jgi:hypothetical protein
LGLELLLESHELGVEAVVRQGSHIFPALISKVYGWGINPEAHG